MNNVIHTSDLADFVKKSSELSAVGFKIRYDGVGKPGCYLQTELKSDTTGIIEYHTECGCGEDKVKSFLYFEKNAGEVVRCVQQMNKTALIDSGLDMSEDVKNSTIEEFIDSCLSGSVYEVLCIYGNKDIFMEFSRYRDSVNIDFVHKNSDSARTVRSYFTCEFNDEKMIPGIMLMHETILDFIEWENLD